MGCGVDKCEAEPRLRLLESDGPAVRRPAASAPSLVSAPFRPGELPLTAWVPLDHATRNLLWEQATQAALPTELWVRIAVEASRLASEISSLTARPRGEVIADLDGAAELSEHGSESLAAPELRRYAAQLRMGHASAAPGELLALRLPEEISGAWSAAAGESRLELPRWLAQALSQAPQNCVSREYAAAAECRSLGEWTYAASLRASASARA